MASADVGGRALYVLLAVTCILLPTVPAGVWAQGSTSLEWGPDVRLSESTELSDDPGITLTPDGGMVITWRERLVGRYSVFFAVLDASGDMVSGRQQLGGEDLPASMDPAVAVDGRGRLHFIWTALEDQELYYARAAADGSIENGPIRLTEASGDSAEASIWMDSRDHLHLVWFDGRDGLPWLYYMQLDQEGRKVVEDMPLVRALTEEESAIAMDSRGDLHVAWNARASPGNIQWRGELHYTKISSVGEVLIADRLVATSRGTVGFPDMAVDLRDHVHLVWPEGLGPRESVMYIELDSSGRTLTEALEASGTGPTAARDVSVAVDGNDNLHLVWSRGVTGTSDLVYMTMAPGGEPLEGPDPLTDARADSREPSIGLSRRGEPRVVWSDWRSGNAEVYLKVASRPRQGVDLGVYARGVVLDPPTPVAGEPAELRVEVTNHGDAPSPESELEVLVDGVARGREPVPGLMPGGSLDVVTHLELQEGVHLVRVVVDPDGEVAETVEVNNAAERTVTAFAPGTLVADAGPDQSTSVGKVVYLDATRTVYVGSGVLSYEWDFDDGSDPGYGLYVEHTYQAAGDRTVTLRVSDGTVEDTDTCLVRVAVKDDPPRAVLDPPGPLTADRLRPVRLSAANSTDDHGVRNATWDLGDGTVAEGLAVSHTYGELATFVVKLTVYDASDQFDQVLTTVRVVNLPPEVADFSGPGSVEAGRRASFSVAASDPDGTVSAIGWDFDARDGVSFQVQGPFVYHSFPKPGTYNVTCIVRDDDGGQTVVNLELRVREKGGGIPAPGAVVAMAALVLAMATLRVRPRALDKKPYHSL